MTIVLKDKITGIIRKGRNEMMPSYEIVGDIEKAVDEEISKMLKGITDKINDILDGKSE